MYYQSVEKQDLEGGILSNKVPSKPKYNFNIESIFLFIFLNLIINNPENTIIVENQEKDLAKLKTINAQFISNFLTQNVAAHDKIIHKDFVCIESNGSIVDRATYLKNWVTDFDNSGYTSFTYQDENIRIFGNAALVSAKTVYTKTIDDKEIKGYTVYTDTYIKENDQWQCVQVQITPVQ
jgi:ketosteroid isomerase-like protein